MDELDLYNDSDLGYDTDWCTETIDSIKIEEENITEENITEENITKENEEELKEV